MIYCYLGVLFCVIFSFLGYKVEKKRFMNPLSLFCVVWAVILVFSSLQLWTLLLPDDNIYILILLGIIFYGFGYLISKYGFNRVHFIASRKNSSSNRLTNWHYIPRYYLLYFLAAATILYYVIIMLNTLSQIQSFSLANMIGVQRSEDYVGYSNRFLNALSVLLFGPMAMAIPAVTAVDFWFGRRDKILFVLNLFILITRTISSGGRSIILIFGIYFIVCIVVYLRKNKDIGELFFTKVRTKRVKKWLHRIIFAIIAVFVIMTVSRGFSGNALFQNVYIAFAIPPRMFEIWGEYVDQQKIIGCGVASLFGYIYPVFYVIKNLLGVPMPSLIESIFDFITKTEVEWVWPGTGMENNAYVSLFWYFYVDGRFFGVVLGMFLLGLYVARKYYSISEKEFSEKNMAIYCLTLYLVIFSFIRLQSGTYNFALAIIYIYFVLYRKSKTSNKERLGSK